MCPVSGQCMNTCTARMINCDEDPDARSCSVLAACGQPYTMPPKARKCATKQAKKKATNARLDAFSRGMIWGMHLVGTPRETIRQKALKKDGTAPRMNAVDKVIAHKAADPTWTGEESSAGGRPPSLSDKQQKSLVRLVFKERGRAIVTVSYCRKMLPFLRAVSRSCVERALHTAGFAYLTRRRKCWVCSASCWSTRVYPVSCM